MLASSLITVVQMIMLESFVALEAFLRRRDDTRSSYIPEERNGVVAQVSSLHHAHRNRRRKQILLRKAAPEIGAIRLVVAILGIIY